MCVGVISVLVSEWLWKLVDRLGFVCLMILCMSEKLFEWMLFDVRLSIMLFLVIVLLLMILFFLIVLIVKLVRLYLLFGYMFGILVVLLLISV